jgi:hypothetical protein
MWWNAHQVPAHSRPVTSNTYPEYCLKVAKTTTIECFLDSFSNTDYKMLAWRNTDRDALLESPPLTTITPKSRPKRLRWVRKVMLHPCVYLSPKMDFWAYHNHIALEHTNFGEKLGNGKVPYESVEPMNYSLVGKTRRDISQLDKGSHSFMARGVNTTHSRWGLEIGSSHLRRIQGENRRVAQVWHLSGLAYPISTKGWFVVSTLHSCSFTHIETKWQCKTLSPCEMAPATTAISGLC